MRGIFRMTICPWAHSHICQPDTGRLLKDRSRGDILEVPGSTLDQKTGYP